MAGPMVSRSLILVVICTCVATCASSPTRRQISLVETTSSDPTVTNEGAVWDDTDDFDLDGDDEWLGDAAPSPSSVPQRPEYEEYDDDDDDDFTSRRSGDVEVDLVDDDIDHQDAEEEVDHDRHDNEFLFLPSRDTRLVLQDDDDPSNPIKVRHTGKNSYSEDIDADNSVEVTKDEKEDSNPQFEFTIDEDDDEEDKQNDIDNDDKDDFVLEDSLPQGHVKKAVLPRREVHDVVEDEDDFVADEDVEDDPMFESPEEDSQVIYGDHVFLY